VAKELLKSLTAEALRSVIEEAIVNGHVRESWHARQDHPERNISLDDVLHGLKATDWTMLPEHDNVRNSWKYKISTEDIEGVELTLVIVPLDANTIRVITKW
jgi:hypothetical protein